MTLQTEVFITEIEKNVISLTNPLACRILVFHYFIADIFIDLKKIQYILPV